MLKYNIKIEADDEKFFKEKGINIDSVLDITISAINRIKCINSEGVYFIESFIDNGFYYFLHGTIFYYKKKKIYSLEVEGVGKMMCIYDIKNKVKK